jgi:hypothetical protein
MWEALCGKRIKQPVALAVLFVLMFIGGCFFVKANQAKEFEKNDYGVFLNADASSLERFKMYETIVIDAQYFTKRDIELLHQNGTVVYTYLNIGSIENFREYYTTYAELAIGEYEHWEEEQWVDVANPDWQKFIGQLSQESVWSGIDFDKGTFHEQMSETRDYFCKYLEACKADGMEVYLLEYTTNPKLIPKNKRILQGARLPFLYFQFP